MMRKTCQIVNKLGLHGRASAKLVQCAGRFQSHIEVERNELRVNGKSIMGVMMLAASQGTWITIEAMGDDEAEALDALEQLICDRFGEGQ